MELKTYEEKPRFRERVKAKLKSAKIAGAAAMAAGAAAVTAIPQGASAVEVTTLQQIALDWGMSVPAIFVMIAFFICLLAVFAGWARTQMGYYLTAGLGLVFLLMVYLGI